MGQPSADLQGEVHHRTFGKGTGLRKDLSNGSPLYPLHRDVKAVFMNSQVIDLDHIGVLEQASKPGFID